ncbi:MAG TPA: ribbon-helix-helix protein, CopG family [Stellaceae bacterium]|nr:ribbon-helix-helix protein, CopG family [Stellaceae bacterium]
MPDEAPLTGHVSLRVPQDLIEAFDRIATALERPRSWVMLRALRHYLDDEGAEVLEDAESIAELDRGEVATSEEMERRLDVITAKAEQARARRR